MKKTLLLAAIGLFLGSALTPASAFADDKPKKEKKKKSSDPAPAEEISFDEFMKVDLSVAKILECEAVENSEKLLKLKVTR